MSNACLVVVEALGGRHAEAVGAVSKLARQLASHTGREAEEISTHLKINSRVFLNEVTFANKFHSPLLSVKPKSILEIISEVNCSSLSPAKKKPLDTIFKLTDDFQPDLTG